MGLILVYQKVKDIKCPVREGDAGEPEVAVVMSLSERGSQACRQPIGAGEAGLLLPRACRGDTVARPLDFAQ